VLASPFKSKSRLEAENAVLRHQLIVLQRKVRGRAHLTNNDRWFFVQMYRWFPSIRKVVTIIEPETLVRWHRASFRRYWRWKSRSRGGRPQIDVELRTLIRRMNIENLLWGVPLDLDVSASPESDPRLQGERGLSIFPLPPTISNCVHGQTQRVGGTTVPYNGSLLSRSWLPP
jgi:hypothetical protein